MQGSWKRLNTLQHYKVSADITQTLIHTHTPQLIKVLEAVLITLWMLSCDCVIRSPTERRWPLFPETTNITFTTATITCQERVSSLLSVTPVLVLWLYVAVCMQTTASNGNGWRPSFRRFIWADELSLNNQRRALFDCLCISYFTVAVTWVWRWVCGGNKSCNNEQKHQLFTAYKHLKQRQTAQM